MAQNSSFYSLFMTLWVVIFIHLFVFHPAEGFESFSVDLIHRDSPKSPYYNSSISHFERLNNAVRRSFSRAARLTRRALHSNNPLSSPEIYADIKYEDYEYLMEVSIGTPPIDIIAIADTGSDLTWTQCQPCQKCYKQKTPIFDPRKSKTYKKMSCKSKFCKDIASRCDKENNCHYSYSYVDGSHTIGDVSTETFTFRSIRGKNVSIPNVVLGCGHDNAVAFQKFASGIVGLGGGEVSLVNQLAKSANGKFSYCLLPVDSNSSIHSKINFGENAVISGPKTVSTPLVKKHPNTYYYLTLEGISVGNKKITTKDFSGSTTAASSKSSGNIIIDSGTPLTYLPQEIIVAVKKTLKQTINGTVVIDPDGFFGLCYKKEENIIKFPDLVVHFTGADITLPAKNTFLVMEGNRICFTMVADDGIAIYGNLAQINFLVGYDLVSRKVSFKPTDCTN